MRFQKVYIELTNGCGLACHFCPSRPKKTRVMELGDAERVLAQLVPYTKNLAFHVLGDPLTLEALPRYMDIAQHYGFGVHLVTSGFHLRKHSPELLRHPALRQLNVSLNSASRQTPRALKAYMDEVLTWCDHKREYAPNPFVNLRLWNQQGDAKDLAFTQTLYALISHSFYHSLQVQLDAKALQEGTYRLDEKIRLHVDRYFVWPSLDAPEVPDGPCHGLRSHIGILSDGTVVPCCLDGEGVLALGNVFTTPLEAILHSPKAQAIRRGFGEKKAVESLCQRCDFRKRFL